MSEDNGGAFGAFMQEQSAPADKPSKSNSSDSSQKSEKEKTALEIKEEEDKKELDEAKKESKANASKYASAQANLVAAQTRRFMILLPFIICAILLLLVLVTKGGDWIQSITQFGLNKLRGG